MRTLTNALDTYRRRARQLNQEEVRRSRTTQEVWYEPDAGLMGEPAPVTVQVVDGMPQRCLCGLAPTPDGDPIKDGECEHCRQPELEL